jgi:hypothetical protein
MLICLWVWLCFDGRWILCVREKEGSFNGRRKEEGRKKDLVVGWVD